MLDAIFSTIVVVIAAWLVLGNLAAWVFLLITVVISTIAVGYTMINQAIRNARARRRS